MKKFIRFSILGSVGLLLCGCTSMSGGGITTRPTRPTTSSPTTAPTSEVPTSISTSELPTSELPTSEPTSVPTTDIPTSEPTSVTSDPTSIATSEIPTSISTSEIPTSISTSELPTSAPTSDVPTTTSETPTDYYASISDSMTGNTLKNALYNLIHPAKATGKYDNIWNDYLLYSDVAHPDRTGKASEDIVAFYRGTIDKRSNMNKEHVWPNSRGGNYIEGDPHMVRPTLISDNSNRGNSFYVEGKNSEHDGWDPKTAGMTENYRGDCARIIFYCAVQEMSYLTLVDKETDATSNNTMGKLSDLLRWNLNYPVQEREMMRNNILNGVISSYGHVYHLNRNPFIDHPEYACKIWGNTNSTTKSICGM